MIAKTVVIFGAGTMGAGIACCAALAGERVALFDRDPQTAQKGIERAAANLRELQDLGLRSEEEVRRANSLIAAGDDLESACSGACLAVEAVYEDLPLKQQVFEMLDRLLPAQVPLLSNTSGLRISDIAARVRHPQRTFTAHFWLPATLIPLVEIVLGELSSPEMAQEVRQTLAAWGKKPVIVKRDLPGQLANRILQAVIREAVHIVEIGLASPEDVDAAIKMGMALRFPVWGPLEHVDAVGFDICESVQNTVLPEISGRRDASPLFQQMRARGELGYKTGRGFYDWSQKDMDAMVKKRNEFIVHALQKL